MLHLYVVPLLKSTNGAKLGGFMSIIEETLPASLEQVKEFIAKQPGAQGFEPYIYIWPDVATYGIRVVEVGLTKGNGGLAFMESDPHSALACFFAERLALEYEYGGDDEDAKNDIADAEWNLAHALFGE
jgi:hypothetical protein